MVTDFKDNEDNSDLKLEEEKLVKRSRSRKVALKKKAKVTKKGFKKEVTVPLEKATPVKEVTVTVALSSGISTIKELT